MNQKLGDRIKEWITPKRLRVLSVVIMGLAVLTTVLPLWENPYDGMQESGEFWLAYDDGQVPGEEAEINDDLILAYISAAIRRANGYHVKDADVPKPEDGLSAEELIALYELPFSKEEYLTYLERERSYREKGQRLSLPDLFQANLNNDRLKSLKSMRTQHRVYTWDVDLTIPESTYTDMLTISDATQTNMLWMKRLLFVFVAGVFLFFVAVIGDTPEKRKCCLFVLIPVYIILFIFMNRSLKRATYLSNITLICENGIAYLIHADKASVIGLYHKEWTEEELMIPSSVEGYPVVSVLSFSAPYAQHYNEGSGNGGIYGRVEGIRFRRIVLPSSVRVLWEEVFTLIGKRDWVRTEALEIGDGVQWIDTRGSQFQPYDIFDEGSTLVIPSQVRYLNAAALAYTQLEEVRFEPESLLTTLPDSCFEQCRELKMVVLPDALQVIGEKAFIGCLSLENITIPETVVSVNIETFCDCEELRQIDLPDSLEVIPYGMFYNCTSLEHITLPAAVTLIGKDAFRGCTSLRTVEGFDVGRIDLRVDAFYDTPFGAEEENFGGEYLEVSDDNALLAAYGVKETVTLPSNVATLNVYRLPRTVKTVIIPEDTALSEISYTLPQTRNYNNPLTIRFVGDTVADTLLSDWQYVSGYRRYQATDEKGTLYPTGFWVVEGEDGSPSVEYAKRKGIPYRITGEDDTVSEEGYLVSYRISRNFSTTDMYMGERGRFYIDLVWMERPDAEPDSSDRYRCRLEIDFAFDGKRSSVGTFLIDDLPADDFTIAPLSTIGFSDARYPGKYGAYSVSVYCGVKEGEEWDELSEQNEAVTYSLFRIFQMEKTQKGGDALLDIPDAGMFTDDGYYAPTERFAHWEPADIQDMSAEYNR